MNGHDVPENHIVIFGFNINSDEVIHDATVKQVCAITGISTSHIRSLVQSGKVTKSGWVFDEEIT